MLPIYPQQITSLRTYNESRSAIIEESDELIKKLKAIDTVGDLKFMSKGFKERLKNIRSACNQMQQHTSSYFEGKTRTERETQNIHIHKKIKFLEEHFKEIVLPIVDKPHTDVKEKMYVECYPKHYRNIIKNDEKIRTKLSDSVTNIVGALSTSTYYEERQNKIAKARTKTLKNIEIIDDIYDTISDNFSSMCHYIGNHTKESEIDNWIPKRLRLTRKIKKLQTDVLLGKVSIIGLLGNLLSEQDIEKLKKHTISSLKRALSVAPKWLRKKFSNITNKLSDTKIQQSFVETMKDYVKQSWKIHKAIYQTSHDKYITDQCWPEGEKMYKQLNRLDERCLAMINQNPILMKFANYKTPTWLKYVKEEIDNLKIIEDYHTNKSKISDKKNNSDSEG